jgi:hypothetical protein
MMKWLLLMAILLIHLKALRSRFTTIAIIASNDIHGTALPVRLLDERTNYTYKYGGLQFMAQMIETIKT